MISVIAVYYVIIIFVIWSSFKVNSSDFFINDILEIASSKQMVELTIATEYNYKDENGNIGRIFRYGSRIQNPVIEFK